MKTYELVFVIDAWLPQADIDAVQTRVLGHLQTAGGVVIATDAIWLLPTAYPINGQDQAYYLSLHIQLDPNTMPELRETYGLEKWLARFAFYGMGENQQFFTYASLAKRYEATLEVAESVQPEQSEQEETQEEEQEAEEAQPEE